MRNIMKNNGKNAVNIDNEEKLLSIIEDLVNMYVKNGIYLAPNSKTKPFDKLLSMVMDNNNICKRKLKIIFHNQRINSLIGNKILSTLRNVDSISIMDDNFKTISVGEITKDGMTLKPRQDVISIMEHSYNFNGEITDSIHGVDAVPKRIPGEEDDEEDYKVACADGEVGKLGKSYFDDVVCPIIQEHPNPKIKETYKLLKKAYDYYYCLNKRQKNNVKTRTKELHNKLRETKEDILPKKVKSTVDNIISSSYIGQSFPIFPGLVKKASSIPFTNELVCHINVVGEGWIKEKSNLIHYIRLKKELEEELEKHNNNSKKLEKLKKLLDDWLDFMGISKLSIEDYEMLFEEDKNKGGYALLNHIIENLPSKLKTLNEFNSKYRIRTVSPIKSNSIYKVSICPYVLEQPDNVHIFIRERETKNYKREDLIKKIEEYVPAIRELFSMAFANNLVLPSGKIYIHYNSFDYDIYSHENYGYSFIYLIKSMIDGAILYLNYTDDSFASKLNNTYFEHIRENNAIYLFNHLNKDTKNSLIHDYYYNLREGMWAYQKLEGKEECNYYKRINVQHITKWGHDVKKILENKNKITSDNLPDKLKNIYKQEIKFIEWDDGFISTVLEHRRNDVKASKLKSGKQTTLDGSEVLSYLESLKCQYHSKLLVQSMATAMDHNNKNSGSAGDSNKQPRYPTIVGKVSSSAFQYITTSLRTTSNTGVELNIYRNGKKLKHPTELKTLCSYNKLAYFHDKDKKYYNTLIISKHNQDESSHIENVEYFIDDVHGNYDSNDVEVIRAIRHYLQKHTSDENSSPVLIYKMIRRMGKHGREYSEVENLKNREIYYCVSDIFNILAHNSVELFKEKTKNNEKIKGNIFWLEELIDENTMVIGAGYSPRVANNNKLKSMVYAHPVILYRYVPIKEYDINKEEIKEKLISTLLFSMVLGDEKGGLSNIGIKRIFAPLHPDFKKLELPSLYILGYRVKDYEEWM